MSESRFSVDDILKEVEMMRSVSSEKPAPPAEPVKTEKPLQEKTPKPEMPVQTEPEKVVKNEESAEKLKDFLKKTEDTGYTPGKTE